MFEWKVSYVDYTGEWVEDLRTSDMFTAVERYAHWHGEGNTARIESYRKAEPPTP